MPRLRAAFNALLMAAPAGLAAQKDTTIRLDVSKQVAIVPTYRLDRRDRLTFEVVNINPFVHTYRFIGKETTYAESAIAEFGKTLLGFGVAAPAAPVATDVNATQGGLARSLKINVSDRSTHALCTAADQRLPDGAAAVVEGNVSALLTAGRQFSTLAGDVRQSSLAFDRSAAGSRDKLRRTDLAASTIREEAIAFAARSSTHLEILRDAKPSLEDAQGSFAARLIAISRLLTDFSAAYPTCQYFITRRADIGTWSADSVAYRSYLTRITDRITALGAELPVMRRAEDESLFSFRRRFGDVDDPEVLDLRLERAFVGDTLFRTIAQPRILFGERRRFSISVGILGSAIMNDQFTIVQKLKSTAGVADTTVHLLSRSSHDALRVAPALSLSARLVQDWGPFAAVRFVVSGAPHTDDAKSIDYFVGPGFSVLDDRMMLTIGVVSGVAKTEVAGFGDGARVPSSLTTAPVSSNRSTALGLGLSFRVY